MNMAELSLAFSKLQFKSDTKTRQRLWRKLSKLLRDGIPIIAGLNEIRGLKKPTAPISVAIAAWTRGMNNGRKLSEVVRPWVTTEEYMLIVAGEESGTLDEALNSVVKVSKAKSDINSAVFGGLAYPFFLMLLSFGILYLFGFKIVPAFTKAARGDAWVGFARTMIDASSFVQNYLHWLALLAITVAILFFVSLPRWTSAFRAKLDMFAPYSIYRVMQGSSWLIAVSALVQAGMPIVAAIEQLGNGASPWLSTRLAAALKGLRAGRNLGEALERSGNNFPDPEIISDIRIYATKSGFDEAIRIIGNEWISESVEKIQGLMRMIFGVSILAVAGLIMFSVSGLIAMQLQLTQLLQQGVR
ncbi:MAG: type II secretion system F family protein [Polaromonas sp.]|uniref:type II secretion system F family protein n=1 Tax=Polaromonas sp. TaxID=1869339 RepID=UPI00248A3292|nr:type II secretion system F family protein [Polaromonas sp.]MDI1236334.1 type II secretion system F family protein [Polaromonas sp.]